jgi:hypothetical protein
MDASAELRAALRDRVGSVLRESGFRGTQPTWVLTAPHGDLGVVNVQRASWSYPGTVSFTVNLAVIPEPWWRYLQSWFPDDPPKKPKEYHGMWRDRLHPGPGVATDPVKWDGWWQVNDGATAAAAADDVAASLRTHGIPELTRLSNRREIIAEAKGPGHNGIGLVVLLADEGPSAELDALLEKMAADPEPDMRRIYERPISWCRENLARLAADGQH